MPDTAVEHIFINFSKRQVKVLSTEGEERSVNWKWDREGTEGFHETVSAIQEAVDPEMITYCFSVK